MQPRSRWTIRLSRGAAALAFACFAFTVPHARAFERPAAEVGASRLIVVAIADKPDPAPSAGATPRGYSGLPDYVGGGERTRATARGIADDYALREVSA
jgi:hypothetical protein